MLCDDCKKNEASFHYKESINNVFNEIHLCHECAKKKNFYDPTQDLLGEMQKFEKFDQSLTNNNTQDSVPPSVQSNGMKKNKLNSSNIFKNEFLKCDTCGLTYIEFRKRGKLGCSDCYKFFKEELTVLLKQIHNSSRHIGKRPVKKEIENEIYDEIKKIQDELEIAVNSEQYEKAIILRDLIKNKYKKLDKKNNSNKI